MLEIGKCYEIHWHIMSWVMYSGDEMLLCVDEPDRNMQITYEVLDLGLLKFYDESEEATQFFKEHLPELYARLNPTIEIASEMKDNESRIIWEDVSHNFNKAWESIITGRYTTHTDIIESRSETGLSRVNLLQDLLTPTPCNKTFREIEQEIKDGTAHLCAVKELPPCDTLELKEDFWSITEQMCRGR